MEVKTLVGKNNYLFLQNDSNRELEVHNNNLCLVNSNSFRKYEPYLNRMLLVVFPNKSLVHKAYLPGNFDLKYRPALDLYKKYFKDRIIDMYPILDKEDSYYKTDTHMNLQGACISYAAVVDRLNEVFGLGLVKEVLNLQSKECVLIELNKGIGDLTWQMNLGDQVLEDRMDTYYYCDELEPIILTYKLGSDNRIQIFTFQMIDVTQQHLEQVIDWNIVSQFMIRSVNNKSAKKCTVLIFYDSFLLSSLSLWMNLFEEVYLVKNTLDPELVKRIKPDYILEFRVERFLN